MCIIDQRGAKNDWFIYEYKYGLPKQNILFVINPLGIA